MDNYELREERSYTVVKANEIIQKARFDLTLSELKILTYIFSKIKPTDTEFCQYEFTTNDYCQVLGIDTNNGKNIRDIKKTLKALRDKSFWLTKEDGAEVTIGWVYKVELNAGSGRIKVTLDNDLQKYLCGLFENFTQYSLLSVLPMNSGYSVRIYELLKSYAFTGGHKFNIDDLKRKLGAEHYSNFKDFRRKVIEVAVKEINLYTDIEVSWEPVKAGKKVSEIVFHIKARDAWGLVKASGRAKRQLDGQLSMFSDGSGAN